MNWDLFWTGALLWTALYLSCICWSITVLAGRIDADVETVGDQHASLRDTLPD